MDLNWGCKTFQSEFQKSRKLLRTKDQPVTEFLGLSVVFAFEPVFWQCTNEILEVRQGERLSQIDPGLKLRYG